MAKKQKENEFDFDMLVSILFFTVIVFFLGMIFCAFILENDDYIEKPLLNEICSEIKGSDYMFKELQKLDRPRIDGLSQKLICQKRPEQQEIISIELEVKLK